MIVAVAYARFDGARCIAALPGWSRVAVARSRDRPTEQNAMNVGAMIRNDQPAQVIISN